MERTNILLGEGAYGRVYEATDRAYVVKVMIVNDEKRIKAAEAECEIHKSLRHHGNLNQLLLDDSGGDLTNLNPQHAVIFADSLLRQMIPVLNYLRKKSVIHRDIKPENILFEYEVGYCKFFLSDFGGVKDLNMGSAHTRRGSSAFIAPEMRDRRLGDQSHALDVYSLFVTTLYVVDESFRTAESAKKYSRILISKGRIQEALKFIHGNIRDHMKTWPESHIEGLQLVHELANLYLGASQVSKAIVLLEYVVAVRKQRLHVTDQYRIASEQDLASAYLLASVYIEGGRIKDYINGSWYRSPQLKMVTSYNDANDDKSFDDLLMQLKWASPEKLEDMESGLAAQKATELLEAVVKSQKVTKVL
ncbi:uncharacterized protein TRIVIDRAFT_71034 [Trichoderma virens Gv29-8]|uniref:Protein kinase domain-containing protein n=1 Tax=Hypocrea virens (strain Gv29-8 / FGSC 10586) TaxID=413071 RepID=G9MUA2_HYPVG|nr:uncharacterized protein TRIVIDRAFT_71034 [Trichoderma virens Gv29-8]EHK21972.1 hypothetical protein TRIVIDRAFT_71034 [Trichoderma virens Gv29-8]UKZ55876.1 hypothetical protein TrVGV298_009700 [Trichoderma virens]